VHTVAAHYDGALDGVAVLTADADAGIVWEPLDGDDVLVVENSGVVLREAAIEEIEELLSLEEGPGVAMAARERQADGSARGPAGIRFWIRGIEKGEK
jgi:hypothetical protein